MGSDHTLPLIEYVKESGFEHKDSIFHLFVGGSELHGAKLHGTDDHDIYGLFLEPPEMALGLARLEHFVWSTATDDRRNTADDIDVTLYSLRKWAGLAAKGNPTALHFVFTENRFQPEHPAWKELLSNRGLFISRRSADQFFGFVEAQLGRLLGTRGKGKKGQRPELESVHGFDVKAGMHAIRLLYEGIELMETAQITLPRPELDVLIAIRKGEWSLDKLANEAAKLTERLKASVETSNLPLDIDAQAINQLVAGIYLRNWARR